MEHEKFEFDDLVRMSLITGAFFSIFPTLLCGPVITVAIGGAFMCWLTGV